MGYVKEISGATTEFTVYWTELGRDYLSRTKNSNNGLLVKYFTLGDSDINYNIVDKNIKDFIPNIAGHKDTTCLFGTLQNNIKYGLEGNVVEVPQQQPQSLLLLIG